MQYVSASILASFADCTSSSQNTVRDKRVAKKTNKKKTFRRLPRAYCTREVVERPTEWKKQRQSAISPISSFQARHVAAMCFSSKMTKKLNNVSISLSECVEHWALSKLPACYRLITGEDDMWRCSRLGIVSLPCPQ